MRAIADVLILCILVGMGVFWYVKSAPCSEPIAYRIGTVDERFRLSEDALKTEVSRAEQAWEETTGRDLFVYDANAALAINLIYDERQAFSNSESATREKLDQAELVNEDFLGDHAALAAQYETLEAAYVKDSTAFEADLNAYNAEVESYNQDGGAPPAEFERLNETKQALDRQHSALNSAVARLQALADEINRLGEEGNSRIRSYNENVEWYNQTFGTAREFTEGDYQGNSINIYTFEDTDELALVLMHELGHALGLDHVENESSVMYWQLGEQEGLSLTTEDRAGLVAVCTDKSLMTRLRTLVP